MPDSVSVRIPFVKMHGLGNDFIVFDAPPDRELPSADRFRRLADRHTGIGFDQALVLEPPRRPGTAAFYRIFNADGIEVEQCGNGARCVAALLHRRDTHARRTVPGEQSATLRMDSAGGLIEARIQGPNVVSVDMGAPNFDPRSLPFEAPGEAQVYALDVEGRRIEIGAVSMGNPHAVLRVPSVEKAEVETLGPALERHPRFPKRVNVGFMEIVDRDRIRLRVFERGAGETLACGTGACAAVAVARDRGLVGRDVEVEVRGGKLRVNWEGRGEPLWLTGPAEVSFEGHVEI